MKHKGIIVGLFVAFSIICFSGCYKDNNCINGNGIYQTELRSPSPFSEVISSGSFDVHIWEGNTYQIEIDAESNLIPLIQTNVSNGKLYIEFAHNTCFSNSGPINITVYMPEINGVELRGSGDVTVNNVPSDNLDISLNGSGKMRVDVYASTITANITGSGNMEVDVDAITVNATVSGSGNIDFYGYCEASTFAISGSGNIYAYAMPQKTCVASVSGSGNISVYAQDLLNARISGSGNIYYKGNPSIIQQITGSGRLIHQ